MSHILLKCFSEGKLEHKLFSGTPKEVEGFLESHMFNRVEISCIGKLESLKDIKAIISLLKSLQLCFPENQSICSSEVPGIDDCPACGEKENITVQRHPATHAIENRVCGTCGNTYNDEPRIFDRYGREC